MIGFEAEKFIKSKLKYALVILIGGIIGNLTSCVSFPYTVSVGSSGAIYALIPMFLVDFDNQREGNCYLRLIFVVLMMTGFGLLNGYTTPGVKGWGYFGGIISGAASLILLRSTTNPDHPEQRESESGIKNARLCLCFLVAYFITTILIVMIRPLRDCNSNHCKNIC